MRARKSVQHCERCARVEPDAFVWRTDDGAAMWACLLCRRNEPRVVVNVGVAMERAASHLDHTHGLVRVWIKRDRPDYARDVQVALPLVLSLKGRSSHHTDA